MNRTPLLMILPALLAASAAAQAQDLAAMQRCRAMGDAAARLACYDAIPLAAAAAAKAPAALVAPAMAAAPATATTPTPAPVVPAAQANFGLQGKAAAAAKAAEPEFVESQITGTFEGWEGRSIIKLANGQVWQIDDGSSASYYLQSPKVKVRRGMLGSFHLDIEGAKRSPRVKRLQ